MVLPQQDASIVITMRMREEVSAGSQRVEAGLNRVGNAASSTTKFIAQNSAAIVGASAALFAGAGALTQFAVNLGLLNEEQAKTAQLVIQGGAAFASFGTFVVQLGTLLATTGLIAKLGGISAAFATIIPAAAAAGLAIASVVESARGAFTGEGGSLIGRLFPDARIPGVPEGGLTGLRNRPIVGGENSLISQAGGGISQIALNVGTLIADEGGMREFSKRLGRILQEESRIGGFSLGR